jgi:hypothetical protein
MSLSTRFSNGWQIALNSFAVLKENRQLILLPILSAVSMLLIIGSFALFLFGSSDWDMDAIREKGTVANYVFLFCYYLVNYFVVVFFNTALVHCTHLYFSGQKPTIGDGLRFSLTRIGAIFSWAVFAATVGLILKIIQDRVGSLGKIITGLIGIVWSIATFFVVPVIAYENLGPIGAFKRSVSLMKEKWGESLSASFSFGLIQLLGLLIVIVPSFLLGYFVHPVAGIALFALGMFSLIVVMSAVKVIFVSAVYHDIGGDPIKHFNQQFAETLFVEK